MVYVAFLAPNSISVAFTDVARSRDSFELASALPRLSLTPVSVTLAPDGRALIFVAAATSVLRAASETIALSDANWIE